MIFMENENTESVYSARGGAAIKLRKKKGFFAEEVRRFKKHRSIIWFVLPAAILAFVFGYIPMAGILIAFRTDFNLFGGNTVAQAWASGTWTLANFKLLFTDETVLLAVKNTLIINLIGLVIVFPLPIIFALLLADIKSPWLSKLILIITCLPNFLSWPIVIGLFQNLLSPVGGAVNNILVNMGILKEPYYFFGENVWFKPLVILLKIWKGTGWSSIIFYAAVASIDKSFFEAATLEGASKIQKIWYITLPTIMPTIALMLVMTLTYIMSAGFEQIYSMMTAATRYEQHTLDTYLYDISIQNRTNTPFATVLGVVNGLIAMFLMLGGNALVKKTLGKSLW